MDQVVKRAPSTQQQTSANSSSSKQRLKKGPVKKIIGLIAALIVIAAIVVGVLSFLGTGTFANKIQKDKYQAVFLTNGQVYFGKIDTLSSKGYALSDIYYLQVKDGKTPDTQKPAEENQNLSLAKLGSELHGPDDAMFIEKDQVLFWENLKDDSQVVKAISQQKK